MTDAYMGRADQRTNTPAADLTYRSVWMSRGGDLGVDTIQGIYHRALLAGRVFEAHFATEGGTATIENNTAVDLTEPFFRMTIPTSLAVIPIMVKVAPAVVWETGDEVILFAGTSDTYTSDGVAADVRSMALAPSDGGAPIVSSAVTKVYDGDSPLTEGTLVNPRIIDSWAALTGGLYLPYEYNALKGAPYTVIHGPASFGVAVARTTTTAEAYYNVVWIELDKAEFSNA